MTLRERAGEIEGEKERRGVAFKTAPAALLARRLQSVHQLLAGIVHAVAPHVVVYDVSDTLSNLT